jgi:hypothetical protein
METMAREKSGFNYPNRMAHIYLRAIEEIIGAEAMNAVLNQANLPQLVGNYPPSNLAREFDFSDFSAIGAALEKMYGVRGERGLGLHAGKACFNEGVTQLGLASSVGKIPFKAISLNAKLKVGSKAMADAFTKFSDQLTTVEETDENFAYIIHRCPVCWGRTSTRPICYIATGILQAGVAWLCEGHYFHVEEVACCAAGAESCVFHIRKEALS